MDYRKIFSEKEWRGTVLGKEFRSTFPAYETAEEFYEGLSQVTPVDYTSEDLSMEDAIAHGKDVLGVLLKGRNLNLSAEHEKVSEALKSVGCVKLEDAHEKFQDNASVGALMHSESAAYPLFAYQQLLDAPSSDEFSFGMDYLVSSEVESSDVYTWLVTQRMAELSQNSTEEPIE